VRLGQQHQLLPGPLPLLDLVLTVPDLSAGSTTAWVLALATVAGFAQLFSP
jgi:hypothetical protein